MARPQARRPACSIARRARARGGSACLCCLCIACVVLAAQASVARIDRHSYKACVSRAVHLARKRSACSPCPSSSLFSALYRPRYPRRNRRLAVPSTSCAGFRHRLLALLATPSSSTAYWVRLGSSRGSQSPYPTGRASSIASSWRTERISCGNTVLYAPDAARARNVRVEARNMARAEPVPAPLLAMFPTSFSPLGHVPELCYVPYPPAFARARAREIAQIEKVFRLAHLV